MVIARVTKVSKAWLQDYVNKKDEERVIKHEEHKELDIKVEKVPKNYGILSSLFIVWGVAPPQCAVIYTDKWKAYSGVLPSKRHQLLYIGNK